VGALAPPGEYDLILAMYDERTGERVNFAEGNGNRPSDFVSMGKIEIR
jgi:hypothetical protein